MGAQWVYEDWQVTYAESQKSTEQERQWTWCVHFADGSQWDGWREILTRIGNSGWEIFSIVPITKAISTTVSATKGYHIFAKKLKA